MFGNDPFYHETTRKMVAAFGTLFNDIKIQRKDNTGAAQKTFKVPLSYGPRQKFLSRLNEDPNLRAPALTLPRIGFEMIDIQYNGERKLTSRMTNFLVGPDKAEFSTTFVPVPYDFNFELTIICKYVEDGTRILEQIVPFFKPDFGVKIELVDEMDIVLDIPIILNSVTNEDLYEGNFEERRVITWTLNFTMQSYFFGPVTPRKVIKFIKVQMHGNMDTANSVPHEYITIRPGLTANGEPTTILANTIPYANIDFDDDWGYITTIEDYEE